MILNILTDANGNIDWFLVIMFLAVLIIIFFASRKINFWYWRITDSIQNQEEQIRLLKKIAGEKSEDNPKES